METIQTNQPLNIQQDLPNSTAVLVLGIISIVSCWCWGFPGLICGIIALVLSSRSEKLYKDSPYLYRTGSVSNLKAGKICAIIGVCLSGILVLSVFVKLVIGVAFLGFLGSIIPFLDK
jgi:hypothetical protein